MTRVPAEQLAEVFVEIADTLVDEFDLIEFLQRVAGQTSRLVDATAVGLLLADHHGRLQMMAASDERTEMVELFQTQSQEGPCQDCFTEGRPVSAPDLDLETSRWPRFARLATSAGFRSVHAFPMRLRQEVIGALNLFGTEPGTISDDDARVVQALADVATIGLLQERAIRRGEVLTEQLQSALNSRIVIEQAKGALAQIHGVSTDEAFTLLRDYARSRRLRLGDVARALTTSPDEHPDLSRPGSR